jgi:hypothetical protein
MRRRDLCGRGYWLGAAVIVLVSGTIAGVVAEFFGESTPTGDGVGIIVGILLWPALIIYHVLWTRRMGVSRVQVANYHASNSRV